MKRLLTLSLASCFLFNMSLKPIYAEGPKKTQTTEIKTSNITPMFGYQDKYKPNEADQKFIKDVLSASNNDNEKAFGALYDQAWQEMLKSDKSNAIKRFNQAWLIKPNDYRNYWGFAVWESMFNSQSKAQSFFESAFNLNKTDSRFLHDYGRFLAMTWSKSKDKKDFDKALKILDLAIKHNPSVVPNYMQKVALYFYSGNYKSAWQAVAAAEKIDKNKVDKNLVAELEKKMPRPGA